MNIAFRRVALSAAVLALVAGSVVVSEKAPLSPAHSSPGQMAAGGVGAGRGTAVVAVTGPDGVRKGTALLVGDSQSAGAAGVPGEDTWPRRGLASLGYSVTWVGAGGTGYAATRPRSGNYLQSYRHGAWKLPPFAPELIVFQGGGNDAGQGKQLSEVSQNARQLAYLMHRRYPGSRLVMVGVLSRSANDGGGRRLVVDSMLAGVAEELRAPFVDPGGWVSTYGLQNDMADGVHLKASGHQRLTPVFAEHLARALEGR
ncbi:SGNH/GDSL hydrolase family protein [Arthrobacter sp. Y-9]|uniref:SGNH/GDSL hydrolase family protein n=1 Tax=Arthrobacter sp. Y-9 TaxID=3039385 RepID=UPI00241FA5CE|nr:SGNH/GDSL hydrolase family protein [Arthrobacter sp. Y-9]WFR83211.1 SGNH/GDSL hydrolase family protein [Arthrobacter sp. Y-9]